MKKLLSISLLTAGVMVAAPAAADDPFGLGLGGRLFIQDINKPIELMFGYAKPDVLGISRSIHSSMVSIGTIDHNGNMVDNWVEIFKTSAHPDKNLSGEQIATWHNTNLDTNGVVPLNFWASAGAVEVVFRWTNQSTGEVYYSDVLGLNPDRGMFPYTTVTYDTASYYDPGRWSQIGMEHFDGAAGAGGISWDWDDAIVTLTNVGATPTPIPEPETYAMMLAGLGLVGAVVRRRRKS
ncbi:MAG: PEPxxWA-CTERM sorting domain-containing protein [Azoarcus sp.]|nr:PEPxxWA-CTERM sorting domain-containing protein [Azoarcus sp.]